MSEDLTAKELFKAEYDRIKSEQAQRIGFRDNMLYVQLAATGAVASWALTNYANTPDAVFAFLVIPWTCIVLGWTYVVNDHHISRIGEYVREVMGRRAARLTQLAQVKVTEGDGKQFTIAEVFGWEPYHRTDKRRQWRKKCQFVVDELTFVLPGYLAVTAYLFLTWSPENWQQQLFRDPRADGILLALLILAESVLLLWLAVTVYFYADFRRGPSEPTRYEIQEKTVPKV